MRILIVTTGLSTGGAESQLKEIAVQLRRREHQVMVVSLVAPEEEAVNLEGIPVESLSMRRGLPDLRGIVRLRRIVRSRKPQVVHAHMVHANLLARVARCFCKMPVLVCTAHNTYEVPSSAAAPKARTWREWAYRLTDPLASVTTQISSEGLDRYVKIRAVPKTKIRLVPNGVDLERFRRNTQLRDQKRAELGIREEFLWLAVGRLEVAKDYPNLLRAFRMARGGQSRLLIAGQGPTLDVCRLLANKLGIGASVQFIGLRKDVPGLMSAADAYVMSSLYEGLPLVLIEAAAAELPIVACDVGGNRDVVVHGQSGFLVPPNDPGALANAMIHVATLTHEERRTLGRNGRLHVAQQFSLDRVVDQWEALYRELLSKTNALAAE